MLALLGEGLSNRDLAIRLVISERTVRIHVSNVLVKLDFHSRTQARYSHSSCGNRGRDRRRRGRQPDTAAKRGTMGHMQTDLDSTHAGDLTIAAAAQAMRVGRLTAEQLLDAVLERVDDRNGGAPSFDGEPSAVNAWARLYEDQARDEARRADKRRAQEIVSPLCGIPLGLKDLFAVGGRLLSASSRQLEGEVAVTDSATWRALKAAGAVLVGHTHTHEFAAGGTTDQVGNPWDLARSPGGSSGGSGAAVAAGMALGALGTDTAGSIRVPAALCGVSAFKGSYGRVPLEGVIPLATTLDHVGPLARTLEDCAILFETLSGASRGADPWGVGARPPVPSALAGSDTLEGVRVAVTDRPDAVDVGLDVREGVRRAREALTALGAVVVEIEAPTRFDRSDFDTILLAEARTYHARFARYPDRYRPSIRESFAPGAPPLPVDLYLKAQARRIELTCRWQEWFDHHKIDVLLEPTTASSAPMRGGGYEVGRAIGGTNPLTCFTALWNATGFPVAAIPAGTAEFGLPVGVSLIGAANTDRRVLEVGIALQRNALPALPVVDPRP